MPLSPAPLIPGTSPLPTPGQRPPDRRALRLGAFVALPVLLVAFALGPFVLNPLVFLTPRFQAQAGSGVPQSGAAPFQGFVFSWTRPQRGGGYTTPASLQNMRSQATLFHMNTVIIPVVADMPVRSATYVAWHDSDKNDIHTLPQSDYVQAIKDARAAGLVPILELVVKQQDQDSFGDDSSTLVGKPWAGEKGSITFVNGSVLTLERGWFDSYTAFAVAYATLSQQYHLPYFIIGDDLTSVTYDTSNTTAQADPGGIDHGVPGESFPNCSGRRDCEWRHVIHAVRSPGYATFMGHQSRTGGGYTGQLIYAANWSGADQGDASSPEFEAISWWDAVDIIGVDAYFPLTQNLAAPGIQTLQSAWQGVGQDLALKQGQSDIYDRLAKVAAQYNRQILFTGAGYASSPGANNN
ncbi:MAG: hypothetical protein ABI068_06325, partial [Ktedonobacterales bacterium]